MFGRSTIKLLIPKGDVRIDATRCVRRRLTSSTCSACATACSEHAISFEHDPLLDTSRCTSCRRCEAACPVGAIEGDQRDLATLAAELAKQPNPVLGCRVPGVQANVQTGCLGFLGSEAVIALGMALPQGVTLNLTRCRECRNASIVAKLDAVLEEVQALPGEPIRGRIRVARTRDEVDVPEPSLSRRGFFSAVGKRCADAAVSIAPRLPETAEPRRSGQQKDLPPYRRLLLRNLSALSIQRRARLEQAIFPRLSFGPTCNNCCGCDGICPTGAISTSRDDPPRPLFHPSLCTNCGVCVQFCPEHAISLLPHGGSAPVDRDAPSCATAAAGRQSQLPI